MEGKAAALLRVASHLLSSAKLEVYENDETVWKENAEWDAAAGHRKLVPVQDVSIDSSNET